MYDTKEDVLEYLLDTLNFKGSYFIIIEGKYYANQEFLDFLFSLQGKKPTKKDRGISGNELIYEQIKEGIKEALGGSAKVYYTNNNYAIVNQWTIDAKRILDKFIKNNPDEVNNLILGIIGYYKTTKFPKKLSNYIESGEYENYKDYIDMTEDNDRYK